MLSAGQLLTSARELTLPERERTVWDRMQAIGLEFLGPQAPHGRRTGAASIRQGPVPPTTHRRQQGPQASTRPRDRAAAPTPC